MSQRTDRTPKRALSSLEALGKIFQLGKNDTAEEEKPVALSVMVVDDHQASAEGLAESLLEWGHEARTAGGVAEAVALMEGWRPDAVVSDLRMDGHTAGL